MNLETMSLERQGKVATLTLDRPNVLNAMNYQGALDLNHALETVARDESVRLLVIRGAGRAFCTGIDLKELSASETPPDYFYRWDRALRMAELMDAFVLCVMHGYALGGGLQLGLASDIRLATPSCQIGLPAIQESIVPGLATFRLPSFIGMGRAKWMVLSGQNVDGRRALEMGLVDHLIDEEGLDAATDALVERYLETCSVGARQSKILLGLQPDLSQPQFFEEYLRRQDVCLASADHTEARAAYKAKRRPEWT